MKPLNKMIALFLVLLMSANTVFASQMASTMIGSSSADTKQQQKQTSMLPCHEYESTVESSSITADMNMEINQEASDCCDSGCVTCVSASVSLVSVFEMNADLVSSLSQALIDNHLADKHAASLYRPPILI